MSELKLRPPKNLAAGFRSSDKVKLRVAKTWPRVFALFDSKAFEADLSLRSG